MPGQLAVSSDAHMKRFLVYDHGARRACVVATCKPLDEGLTELLARQDIAIFAYWDSKRVAPLLALHISSGGSIPSLQIHPPDARELPSDYAEFETEHRHCLSEGRSLVVRLTATQELLLCPVVGLNEAGVQVPVYWGYLLPSNLASVIATLVEKSRLALILDLDETLLVANALSGLENKAERAQEERRALAQKVEELESDTGVDERQRLAFQLAVATREEELWSRDAVMLRQYADNNYVRVGGAKVTPTYETAYAEDGTPVSRPVIRLDNGAVILTRVDPARKETSVLMRPRPGWEALRTFLAGDQTPNNNKMKFDVYVCTAAERGYALEVWRLLDPQGMLFPDSHRGRRITNVTGREKKTLLKSLGLDGSLLHLASGGVRDAPDAGILPLAVVIDDRTEVWETLSQNNVLQVLPFTYYRDEALRMAGSPLQEAVLSDRELTRVLKAVIELRKLIYFDVNEKVRVAMEPLLTVGVPTSRMAAELMPALVPSLTGVGTLLKDATKARELFSMPTASSLIMATADGPALSGPPQPVAGPSTSGALGGTTAAPAAPDGATSTADGPSLKPKDPRKQRQLAAQQRAAAAAADAAHQQRLAAGGALAGGTGADVPPAGPPRERRVIQDMNHWNLDALAPTDRAQPDATATITTGAAAGMVAVADGASAAVGVAVFRPSAVLQQRQDGRDSPRLGAAASHAGGPSVGEPLQQQQQPVAPAQQAGQGEGGAAVAGMAAAHVQPAQLLLGLIKKHPTLQPALQQYYQKNGTEGLLQLLEKLQDSSTSQSLLGAMVASSAAAAAGPTPAAVAAATSSSAPATAGAFSAPPGVPSAPAPAVAGPSQAAPMAASAATGTAPAIVVITGGESQPTEEVQKPQSYHPPPPPPPLASRRAGGDAEPLLLRPGGPPPPPPPRHADPQHAQQRQFQRIGPAPPAAGGGGVPPPAPPLAKVKHHHHMAKHAGGTAGEQPQQALPPAAASPSKRKAQAQAGRGQGPSQLQQQQKNGRPPRQRPLDACYEGPSGSASTEQSAGQQAGQPSDVFLAAADGGATGGAAPSEASARGQNPPVGGSSHKQPAGRPGGTQQPPQQQQQPMMQQPPQQQLQGGGVGGALGGLTPQQQQLLRDIQQQHLQGSFGGGPAGGPAPQQLASLTPQQQQLLRNMQQCLPQGINLQMLQQVVQQQLQQQQQQQSMQQQQQAPFLHGQHQMQGAMGGGGMPTQHHQPRPPLQPPMGGGGMGGPPPGGFGGMVGTAVNWRGSGVGGQPMAHTGAIQQQQQQFMGGTINGGGMGNGGGGGAGGGGGGAGRGQGLVGQKRGPGPPGDEHPSNKSLRTSGIGGDPWAPGR